MKEIPQIRLYNSYTRKKDLLTTHEPGKLGMYTCGPTVYHYAHIGNLRSYIMEDVLEKYLRYTGYNVKRVMNITDVGHLTSDADEGEDKMLVLSAMCFLIEAGVMPAWAVAAVIFREFAVSGLRLIAAQKNIVIAAAQSGKVKTACTMICLALMLLFLSRPLPFLNGICTGLILVTTLYSGFEYFKNNIQVFKETE